MNDPIRLQKYISDCGLMSRRSCEDEIKLGRFKVNGHPASLGQKIDPDSDVVEYNGKVIQPKKNEKIYLAIYKPRGYVTTLSDEKGRKCITELVGDLGARVYPVGRLDMASEGLLLLTNDGAVADRLMHPKGQIPKMYTVKCRGKLTAEQLAGLTRSINIDGRMSVPAEVESADITPEGNTSIKITLFEGRNRQIRRLCESVGAEVRVLRRVAIGDITLGGLRPGEFRHLTREQINYLKRI